ncbi:MAG: hypothetical protein ACLQSR_00890 [Limisphaerales bacterium]
MGYFLQALIGKADTLGKHTSEFRHVHLILLPQGMAMIPLTDDLHDEIDGDNLGFVKLTSTVEQWAQRISSLAPVAYVEAEFFGGAGGQNAVVWSNASRVLGPIDSKHAINEALRFLGVQIGRAHDEFDAVGLGKHRNTNDWIL